MDPFFDWVIHHFQREWGVITGAPVLFAAALGLGAILYWFVFERIYGDRLESRDALIATKDAHIAFVDGQLREYKSRLSGATPDQAAQEIDKLKADLASTHAQMEMITKWYQYQTSERHLTQEQKSTLRTGLERIPDAHKEFIHVGSIAEPEAQQFALELMAVFRQEGICMDQAGPSQVFTNTPDERGLMVVVVDEKTAPCLRAYNF